MKTWQENQLQALQSIQCEEQFFQLFQSFSKELGFDYCAYGVRMSLPLTKPKTLTFNNYPAAWQTKYHEKNYLESDPTVRHGISSLQPLIWTDELFSPARELWEEAHGYGLCYGWAQSASDFNGVIGMLTLARSHEPLTEAELAGKQFQMVWLTQMAHSGMSQLLVPKWMPEINAKLSNREIEILRWTADGKTSSEISSILNIAERTVNFHINNILVKLNAVNKTSAVIKAAMFGIL